MKRANNLFPDKYDLGQRTHGGVLDFKVNWEEIEFEACDFWFYLQSLKYKYTALELAYRHLDEENKRLVKKLESYGE